MRSRLEQLLRSDQPALASACSHRDMKKLISRGHAAAGELGELLAQRNGFYAFESALLVRPLANRALPFGILQWNVSSLWKEAYEDAALDGLLCFAEDAFGGQFALDEKGVVAIDPETGEREEIADT